MKAFFWFSLFWAALLAAQPLPRSTPEAEGMPSQAILDFIEAAETQVDALHSVMIVRHGRVIAEGWWKPYGPEHPHMLYSLSKSFTATAVGLAVAEGRLSLDDTVLSFFPDEAPADPSPNLRAMRIRDLLRMTSGHQDDTVNRITATLTRMDVAEAKAEQTWAAKFLALAVEHKPGTHFRYNSGASYMLAAVLQKITGMTLMDYLTPRLFEPLGITRARWESNAEGINLGGWGLYLCTEDIAKFGQLYLQKGVWQGKRLLSEEWVDAATSLQTSNGSNPESDWEQGYGFQFWRCRYGAYRGDGAFGQYCIVMPQQEAVIAMTGGVRDMQAVLNLVWKHLLPAMGNASLPPSEVQGKLTGRLAQLALPMPAGESSSPMEKKIERGVFQCEKNELGWQSLEIKPKRKELTLTIKTERGQELLTVGRKEWSKGAAALTFAERYAYAAAGAWVEPTLWQSKVVFYETPYIVTLELQVEDNRLLISLQPNVSFTGAQKTTVTAVKR